MILRTIAGGCVRIIQVVIALDFIKLLKIDPIKMYSIASHNVLTIVGLL